MSKMYEIDFETQFEIVFKETTLEDAIGVTYEEKDVREYFNDGEEVKRSASRVDDHDLVFCYKGYWSSPALLRVQEVIREVKKRLKPKEPVDLDLTDDVKENLKELNFLFKRHGFMYRPKYGHFVVYKVPKVNTAKLKSAPKAVLSDVRTAITSRIGRLLGNKYGIDISIDYPVTKRIQHGAVKLAHANGISFEAVMTYDEGYRGNLYGYIKHNTKGELGDITIKAIIDWWGECIKTDLPANKVAEEN